MKDNQAKYPQLRFKGFTDPWEQDKLDYIFDILDGDRGKNYPSESDFLEEGPTLFLDTGNVRKNGFLFNTTKYITKERDCSLRSGKLQLFDFVLTSRGTLGNVAYYDKKTHVEYQSVRINSAMLILRPIRRNIFSDLYLKVVLHGNLIENFMKKNHVGSAQPHITKKDFSKMLVGIPSTFKEQEKIGLLFNNLDFLITLQQRQLDLYKKLKKGLLQKLFPKNGSKFPQLRFAGFADAWEKRKLGAITDSFSGGTPTAGKAEYYGGEIPFIRSGEISSDSTELFITDAGLNNSSAKMVGIGDILYALYGATSGETSISRINGAINQAILAIRPTKGDDPYMIVQWLKKQKEPIISTYLQGGQGNLSGSIVKDLLITLPKNKDEQAKVGSFFKQLDQTITLHQRKLEKLQELKKGYLQKMFC